MNNEQLNQYAEKLCEEIKLHYLKDYMLCAEGDNWAFKSESSLRNFVLSRPGWERGSGSEELFIFGKHPLIVNIVYCGSAGMLLITTAINIAKAELIDELNKIDGSNLDDNVDKIVKCVKDQDWIIPFVRKKNV
jgi:hypothetical protein